MKKSILFVCNGNIHRSVIAAICAQSIIQRHNLSNRYESFSRGLQGSYGTNPPRHPNLRDYTGEWALTSPALKEIGVEIPLDQKATPITREIAERASLILAMDRLVLSEKPNSLLRQFPDLALKMHLFSEIGSTLEDIPDPAGKKDALLHQQVVLTINSMLQNNLETLLSIANGEK